MGMQFLWFCELFGVLVLGWLYGFFFAFYGQVNAQSQQGKLIIKIELISYYK